MNKHEGHKVVKDNIVGFDCLFCQDCDEIVSYIPLPKLSSQKKGVDKVKVEKTIEFKETLGLELNTIYNEKEEETISRIMDKSIDYVITSPPYNFAANTHLKEKYTSYKDDLSEKEYTEWQIKVISSLLRITRYHIFYNTQLLAGNKMAIPTILECFKKNLKEIVIWDKNHPINNIKDKTLDTNYEFIFIFSNDNPSSKQFSDANWGKCELTNLWRLNRVGKERYKSKNNAAIFPLALPMFILRNFGKEGNTVYDPYMGSGTTAVACSNMNRKYIGSEIDRNLVKEANERVNNRQLILI